MNDDALKECGEASSPTPCKDCEFETLAHQFHQALGWDCQSCQVRCPCAGCEKGR